jgi:hypothetical protein
MQAPDVLMEVTRFYSSTALVARQITAPGILLLNLACLIEFSAWAFIVPISAAFRTYKGIDIARHQLWVYSKFTSASPDINGLLTDFHPLKTELDQYLERCFAGFCLYNACARNACQVLAGQLMAWT